MTETPACLSGRAVYRVTREGQGWGEESFSAQGAKTSLEISWRLRLLPEGASLPIDAGGNLLIATGAPGDLEIDRIDLNSSAACARYSWNGDSWTGLLRSNSGAVLGDSSWPLSRGMWPCLWGALSDSLLIRRANLRPFSQKRIELLRVDPATLSVGQTHVILDSLETATRETLAGRLEARRFRCVEASGESSDIWAGADGVVIEKSSSEGLRWELLKRE